MEKNEKKCWKCHRILVGESKVGLCPDCMNSIGTPVAFVVGGVALGGLVKGIKAIVKGIIRS